VFTNPREKNPLFHGPLLPGLYIYIYISQTCDIAKLANFSKTSANLVELTLVEKQKIPKKS
jgi:hypothetical protein